jgi:hypothetical protein
MKIEQSSQKEANQNISKLNSFPQKEESRQQI